MRERRVTVNLTPEEAARLDELRPKEASESAFFRELLRRTGPLEEEASHAIEPAKQSVYEQRRLVST